MWEKAGDEVDFFINDEKNDWSSVLKGWAEKGGHTTRKMTVNTTDLAEMFSLFGIPHYVKCDIEGADLLFSEQLINLPCRPPYVSVEAISPTLIENLQMAQYVDFRIRNQAWNGYTRSPNPPLEGNYVEVKFDGHMSGLFGRELPSKNWLRAGECFRRYHSFVDLKKMDETLAHGWLDFHARQKGAAS